MNSSRAVIPFHIAILMAALTTASFCAVDLNWPPPLRAYYERDGSASEGGMSEWQGRGREFVVFFRLNWRALLHSWELSPPTAQQAALIRSAAEALPGRDYLDFLNTFLTHFEKGRINENVMGNAMAGMGEKMGFIPTNFQDPDVRKLVNRYRDLISADPDQTRWCDSLLKGDLRYQHQMFRGKSQPAPEILPAPKTSSPSTRNSIKSPNPMKAPDGKQSTDKKEPASSSPWSIIVVLIVAATGLLWLLVKKRK